MDPSPIAVLSTPLAVLPAPYALLPKPDATLPSPLATPKLPVALLKSPIAVDWPPVAVAWLPMAVLRMSPPETPAIVPGPIATSSVLVACTPVPRAIASVALAVVPVPPASALSIATLLLPVATPLPPVNCACAGDTKPVSELSIAAATACQAADRGLVASGLSDSDARTPCACDLPPFVLTNLLMAPPPETSATRNRAQERLEVLLCSYVVDANFRRFRAKLLTTVKHQAMRFRAGADLRPVFVSFISLLNLLTRHLRVRA